MIGSRLKSLRQSRGYSISELAKRAGVSKSYLSHIERNLQVNPSLQLLSKLALTLNVPVDDIIGADISVVSNNEQLDADWTILVKEAIDNGLSKEEFKDLSEYIRFKNSSMKNT